jgi:hypothetical protein
MKSRSGNARPTRDRRELPAGLAIAAGWAFYLVTLLPVIGLVKVGEQAASDRYAYLAMLGPALVLGALAATAWGVEQSAATRGDPGPTARVVEIRPPSGPSHNSTKVGEVRPR